MAMHKVMRALLIATLFVLGNCFILIDGLAQENARKPVIKKLFIPKGSIIKSPTLPIPPPSSRCFKSVQGKLAWNKAGAKQWAVGNVNALCKGAENSSQPGLCFDYVLHRNSAPNNTGEWNWQSTTELCKGSLKANNTIRCFNTAIARGVTPRRARQWCGNYRNVLSNKAIPIGDKVRDVSISESTVDAALWSVADGIGLTPNELTSRAIKLSQYSERSRHSRKLKDVRYVDQNGVISRDVAVFDEKTGKGCQRACATTESCNAYIIKETEKDQIGGYCGLIFGDVFRRHDRSWVKHSKGFTTYFDPSEKAVSMLPVRLVVEATRGDNKKRSLPLHEKIDHTTIGSNIVDCAKRCVSKSICSAFIYTLRSCFLYENPLLSNKTKSDKFLGEFDFMGTVGAYDTPKLNRSTVDFDMSKGLSLFGPRALASAKVYESVDRKIDETSAYLMPNYPNGEPWIGDTPIVRGSEAAESLQSIDLNSFIVGSEGRTSYLPFDEKVWASSTEPGTYYFTPRQFRFDWDSVNKRLGGSQFFNSTGTIGGGNDVRLTIKLSSKFHEDDLVLFKEVVNAYLADKNLPTATRLKRLPLESSPKVDLARSLTSLGVGEQQVEAPVLSDDLTAPIHLTFSVNDLTAQSLLENFTSPDGDPVGGNLLISPSTIEAPAIPVPVVLDTRDPLTYGANRVVNGQWKNDSPYPAKVKRLNVLLIHPDRAEILSWVADDHEFVASGGTTGFKLDSDAHSLLARANKIWVDYTLDKRCSECARSALGIAAVSGVARSRITFSLLGFGAQEAFDQIKIGFRSKYLNVNLDSVQQADSLFIAADANQVSSPSLYLPDGKQLDSDFVAYQFRLTKYAAGQVSCTPWLDGTEKDVVLTPRRFEEGNDGCAS